MPDGSDRHFMGILEFHINIKWMFWRYSKAESAIHWCSRWHWFLIIFFGSLLLGIVCAWKEGGWTDRMICKVGTVISCVPEFWLALVLILVFSVSLRWLPSSGAYAVGQENNLSDRIVHMILPLAVIVTEHLWYYGYMVRNKMLDEVGRITCCWRRQRE